MFFVRFGQLFIDAITASAASQKAVFNVKLSRKKDLDI